MTNQEILSMYQSGQSTTEIGRFFGVSNETIRVRLINLGITRRGSKKYYCNESRFSIMDNKTAYWLGFIYADGNVYKNTLAIKLGLQDKEHLTKFKNFMEYTGKIEITDNYSRIRIHSPIICQNLDNWNVYPNKTHSLSYIETGYDADFIRGFFDGDGWRTKARPSICFSSCSLSFIQTIKSKINNAIGREVGSIITVNKGGNAALNYSLSFAGSRVIQAINDYMWNNECVCLKRKSPII